MYIFMCGFAHTELLRLVDLHVWSFASVTVVRVDMLSHYHSICGCIQLETVSEHNVLCECYSSHSETEILAMNVTVK